MAMLYGATFWVSRSKKVAVGRILYYQQTVGTSFLIGRTPVLVVNSLFDCRVQNGIVNKAEKGAGSNFRRSRACLWRVELLLDGCS
jgi:hypothetical protein